MDYLIGYLVGLVLSSAYAGYKDALDDPETVMFMFLWPLFLPILVGERLGAKLREHNNK